MNRTAIVTVLLGSVLLDGLPGQTPAGDAKTAAKADPIGDLVVAMRAAEAKLRSVTMTMSTRGRLPGGEEVTTRGSLRVLRGEQPATHTRFEYSFGSGVRGRSEMVQSAAGILLLEDDPMFGEVFVQIDSKTVTDLEWAGEVLHRDDLPGMAPQGAGTTSDRRAATPLGSSVLAAMHRQFELVQEERSERGGESGRWFQGKRRAGLDAQDAELPLAERVALFVRTADLALLELEQFAGDAVLQRLVVEELVVDPPLDGKTFTIDAGKLRPRPVQQVPALFESIEQAILRAEVKSPGGELRPSKR